MRAAIILAAGRSRRFGAANKLLARYRGKPLLQWAIESALRAPVGRVIVVVGPDRRVQSIVHRFPAHRVASLTASRRNRARHVSLLCGLRGLRGRERQSFVFLGDVPDLPAGIGVRLAMHAKRGHVAIRAGHHGTPGHPVLIADTALIRNRLASGEGPFARNEVRLIEGGPGVAADIDRPGDRRAIPACGYGNG